MTTIYEEISPNNHSSKRRDAVGPPQTKKMKIEPMKEPKQHNASEATKPTNDTSHQTITMPPIYTRVDFDNAVITAPTNPTTPPTTNHNPSTAPPTKTHLNATIFAAFQATVVTALKKHVTADADIRRATANNNKWSFIITTPIALCGLFSCQDLWACHAVQFRKVKLDFQLYYMFVRSVISV